MVIPVFLNDHYEDCIMKIEDDFKVMEVYHAVLECSICCMKIERNEEKRILKCLHCYHNFCIES